MEGGFLVGPRINLRWLSPDDVTDRYVRWLNDPEVTHYLHTGRTPVTMEQVREYVGRFQRSTTDLIFAIVDRDAGHHIGNVTLNRIDWISRTADTGILIGDREFWGRGYATEAWSLVLEYAFHRLGLQKITAGAVVGNQASLAVLKKLGFVVEGTLRRQMLVDGQYQDVVWLGVLREEFRSAL